MNNAESDQKVLPDFMGSAYSQRLLAAAPDSGCVAVFDGAESGSVSSKYSAVHPATAGPSTVAPGIALSPAGRHAAAGFDRALSISPTLFRFARWCTCRICTIRTGAMPEHAAASRLVWGASGFSAGWKSSLVLPATPP